MSSVQFFEYALPRGGRVPVRTLGGDQVAIVTESEHVPTSGHPNQYLIRVRVQRLGGGYVDALLTPPGGEPTKSVVVLIDN